MRVQHCGPSSQRDARPRAILSLIEAYLATSDGLFMAARASFVRNSSAHHHAARKDRTSTAGDPIHLRTWQRMASLTATGHDLCDALMIAWMIVDNVLACRDRPTHHSLGQTLAHI